MLKAGREGRQRAGSGERERERERIMIEDNIEKREVIVKRTRCGRR